MQLGAIRAGGTDMPALAMGLVLRRVDAEARRLGGKGGPTRLALLPLRLGVDGEGSRGAALDVKLALERLEGRTVGKQHGHARAFPRQHVAVRERLLERLPDRSILGQFPVGGGAQQLVLARRGVHGVPGLLEVCH